MGIRELLAAGVDFSKVDTGALGMAQYGILGNKLLKEAKQVQEEMKNVEKPGRYCDDVCTVNEACEECSAMQAKFDKLMLELEQLENAADASKNESQNERKKLITKCTLCGAPYEQGLKSCAYCDTPYETVGISSDLPQSSYESGQLLKKKAGETYAAYMAFKKLSMENRQKTLTGDTPKIVQSAIRGFTSKLENTMMLTPDQIYAGAKKHNMKLSAYICGVIDGTIKSENQEKLEETSRQMEEYNRQQQAYYERNRQIEKEKQEKLRKTNKERNEAIGNLFYSQHVKMYSNEPKQECWSCRHFYIAKHLCTRTNCSEDPSHCCVFWEH